MSRCVEEMHKTQIQTYGAGHRNVRDLSCLITAWTTWSMFWDASPQGRWCSVELPCALGFLSSKQVVLSAWPPLEIMLQWCLVGLSEPGNSLTLADISWFVLGPQERGGFCLANCFVWCGLSKELPSNCWDIFIVIFVVSWAVCFFVVVVGWFKVWN